MPTQPIDPVSDSRIAHKTAVLNGYTYHYLYAEPQSGSYSQTVFLVCLSYLIEPPDILHVHGLLALLSPELKWWRLVEDELHG